MPRNHLTMHICKRDASDNLQHLSFSQNVYPCPCGVVANNQNWSGPKYQDGTISWMWTLNTITQCEFVGEKVSNNNTWKYKNNYIVNKIAMIIAFPT